MHMERPARRELGRRIKRARESRGLTGAECARRAETTAHNLWRYEDGRVVPGVDVLARIAKVCAVSLDWLATGEGDGPAAGEPTADEAA